MFTQFRYFIIIETVLYFVSAVACSDCDSDTYFGFYLFLELDTVDSDHVYILGGLVDETIKKHLSQGKASERGIVSKRLPIDSMMHRSGHHSSYSKVLAINQGNKLFLEALSVSLIPWKMFHPLPLCGSVFTTDPLRGTLIK